MRQFVGPLLRTGNVNVQELQMMFPLLEAIVSYIDEGVLIAGKDGQVLFQNPAAGELLGMKVSMPVENLGDAGGIDLFGQMQKAREQQQNSLGGQDAADSIRFERRIHVGGAQRDLEFHCCRASAMTGDMMLLIVRDRTAKRRLEAVLDRASSDLITNDPQMMGVIERVKQVAPTDASVLIQGESGTGKTHIARMVYHNSQRADKPLVEVNCAAIPESLIESELFGHVKGAFTGASQERPGRFLSANGGTLFLDEVGEIPLHLQAKLLRVIQDKEFEPVGSDKPIKVDVRIIAASNQNLRQNVDNGEFRSDLYYRLAVIPLYIPALRERPGDIPLLLQYFCHNLERRGYADDVECGAEAMRMMMDYPWPGNVRELENAVEHALICAVNKKVSPESLPQDVRVYADNRQDRFAEQPAEERNGRMRQDIVIALDQAGGNKSKAAESLGIDRSTLWRRMRKMNLQ